MKHKALVLMSLLLTSVFIFNSCGVSKGETAGVKKEIYEWRIFTVTGDETMLDNYFKDALIPAYGRFNIPVGAFKTSNPKDKNQRYLIFVYPDLSTYDKVRKAVWEDKAYQDAARSFFEASAPKPVYSDFQTYICEAFDKLPQMRMPDKSRTVFEYRNYYSPNEDANKRKINMFNVEEIATFEKVGVNGVCYGEILSGTRMPALIYLTWFKDEESRVKAWADFNKHPDWLEMRNRPQYRNSATNNQSVILAPMPYSKL